MVYKNSKLWLLYRKVDAHYIKTFCLRCTYIVSNLIPTDNITSLDQYSNSPFVLIFTCDVIIFGK